MRITISYSDLRAVTDSIVEIPEVGIQLPEWQAMLQLQAEYCFTSTETIGLIGTGAQDGHLDFHTAPELNAVTCTTSIIMDVGKRLHALYTFSSNIGCTCSLTLPRNATSKQINKHCKQYNKFSKFCQVLQSSP